MRLDTAHEYKTNKLQNGFWIFIGIFSLIWCIGFFLSPKENEDFNLLEWIVFIVPTVLILSVGVPLYLFFNKQVVDINVSGDKIIFIKNSGNVVMCNMEENVQVKEEENKYIFIINNIKMLSAYKYMPPEPMKHRKFMKDKIATLESEGVIHYKRKAYRNYDE